MGTELPTRSSQNTGSFQERPEKAQQPSPENVGQPKPATFERALIDHLDSATAAIADAVAALDLPAHAPELAKPSATEVGYFTGNHHRMQHTDFKANGYYIGSGPVESACNTIVKQRAKRAGMHWTINGLDPVLAIRTLHQSRREQILWPTPQT